MNKIETVIEQFDIINIAVKLIWNGTERNISFVTFNGETATVLSQDSSIVVDLVETDAVIIKGETYRKLMEKITGNEEMSNIDNETNVSKVHKSTTQVIEVYDSEKFNEIMKDLPQPIVLIDDPISELFVVNNGKCKVKQISKTSDLDDFGLSNNSDFEKLEQSSLDLDISSLSLQQPASSYSVFVITQVHKRRKAAKKKHTKVNERQDVLDEDEIMFDVSSSLNNDDNPDLPQPIILIDDSIPRTKVDERQNVLDDNEIMLDVSSSLNNDDTSTDTIQSSQVDYSVRNYQLHKTPDFEGDQTDEIKEQNYEGNQLRKSNILGELGNEFTEENQKLQLTTIKKDIVLLLNNNFKNSHHYQLEICGDKLFSKSNLIEKLLTENFDHLFSHDKDIIQFSLQPLPFNLQQFDSLDNCFKEWEKQYKMLKSFKFEVQEKNLKMIYKFWELLLHLIVSLTTDYKRKENRSTSLKILRRLVSDKIKSILLIDERQEHRYWYATWQLIELLNLTQCPGLIFVKSGINPRFFKKATKCEYDKFLKELLNDEEAYHKAPKFDESLMDKIIEKVKDKILQKFLEEHCDCVFLIVKNIITFDKSVSKDIKLELINIITINQLHADKKVVYCPLCSSFILRENNLLDVWHCIDTFNNQQKDNHRWCFHFKNCDFNMEL
ncbi:31052_t:CDS:10, partial [Gigaspora margarita]